MFTRLTLSMWRETFKEEYLGKKHVFKIILSYFIILET